jgi:hypothetical protein
MSDQLPMFGQTTSEDTPSAISSPGSVSGPTRSVSPDGRTKGKSGPAPVPANLSARPVKAKRSTMKGIFGQSSFDSSKHEDLSYALASKLRPLTDSLGSTLFNLTWTVRITPAGRSISALRASEPLTEGSVFIGWPTPNTPSGGPNSKRAERNAGGPDLDEAATLAGWPTSRAEDAESSGMRHARGLADTLTAVASLTGWGTPAARDWKSGDASQETLDKNARPLSELAKLEGWATPKVQSGDYQYRGGNPLDIALNLMGEAKLPAWNTPKKADGEQGSETMMRGNLTLLGEARLTAFGDKPIGYLLGLNGWEIVPACGQLNAAHSRWLMGLPKEWDDCGVTAMASLRRPRKRSSKRTCPSKP